MLNGRTASRVVSISLGSPTPFTDTLIKPRDNSCSSGGVLYDSRAGGFGADDPGLLQLVHLGTGQAQQFAIDLPVVLS